MEDTQPGESLANTQLTKRAVGAFIAGVKFVGHQLATADLNPHEGRLRASTAPIDYVNIPDYPPLHDDNL